MPVEEYERTAEEVTVISLVQGEFVGVAKAYGIVRKAQHVDIRVPNVGGHAVIVEDILFKAGDFIKKGMPLIKFSCEELKHKLDGYDNERKRSSQFYQRVSRTPDNVSDYEIKEAELKFKKAESEYLSLKSFIESLDINAPFDGYMSICDLVIGEKVKSDKHVASIVGVGQDNSDVEFYIDPENRHHIQNNDTIVVSTTNLENHSTANIVGINPFIDPNNGKIKVVAKLTDSKISETNYKGEKNNQDSGKFYHNLNVDIFISKKKEKLVYVLPKKSVIKDGISSFVIMAVRGYNGYETKVISVDVIDVKNEICAIRSDGLKEGDYIICEGFGVKKSGIPVHIREVLN